MDNDKQYIFKSERLGFRNWALSDVKPMAAINADKAVMEFFPSPLTLQQTRQFIARQQKHFRQKDFCYFAVDQLEDSQLIGFIGLSEKTFASEFTPCIDIGWRLKKEEWNKGYATEGATRCLQYAFHTLQVKKVNAMAPKINIPSENVMKKLGMQKVLNFNHPELSFNKRLRECVLYEIKAWL